EANEALFKLARKFGNSGAVGPPRPTNVSVGRAGPSPPSGRYEVLTFEGSFHGRTLAGISATGQEKVKKGFELMVEGFRHVPFNDLDAVAKAVRPETDRKSVV